MRAGASVLGAPEGGRGRACRCSFGQLTLESAGVSSSEWGGRRGGGATDNGIEWAKLFPPLCFLRETSPEAGGGVGDKIGKATSKRRVTLRVYLSFDVRPRGGTWREENLKKKERKGEKKRAVVGTVV